MKAVTDYLSFLNEPMTLYFGHYENIPKPISLDKDVIIKDLYFVQRTVVGNRSWIHQHEFSKHMEDLQEQAVAYLTEYYYQKIESPAILETVYRDLSQQLSGITEKYQTTNINGYELYYSNRITLQIQTATARCQYSGNEFPSYEIHETEELVKDKHYQIINEINKITEAEKKNIESFKAVLQKYKIIDQTVIASPAKKRPGQNNKPTKIPDNILREIYSKFSQYMQYDTEQEFTEAVNNYEKIKYRKGFSNECAYLFYEVMKILNVHQRKDLLHKYFGTYTKERPENDKPILNEIDDYLTTIDENYQA